jgi:hypothetical protein
MRLDGLKEGWIWQDRFASNSPVPCTTSPPAAIVARRSTPTTRTVRPFSRRSRIFTLTPNTRRIRGPRIREFAVFLLLPCECPGRLQHVTATLQAGGRRCRNPGYQCTGLRDAICRPSLPGSVSRPPQLVPDRVMRTVRRSRSPHRSYDTCSAVARKGLSSNGVVTWRNLKAVPCERHAIATGVSPRMPVSLMCRVRNHRCAMGRRQHPVPFPRLADIVPALAMAGFGCG